MNSRKACCFVFLFSLGYFLGYLTLFWTYSFHKKLNLYDTKKYLVNEETFRQSRDVSVSSKEGCAKSLLGQSHAMNKYSYLLVLYYHEQISSALSNLFHLGPVAMNLDVKIVEPFVVHSRLYGLPDMLPPGEVTGKFYSLRTLFDINSINQSLYTYANVSLSSFQDFVLYAPRDVVVVYFMYKEVSKPRSFRISYRYLRILKLVTEAEIPVIDCTNEVFFEEQIYGGLVGTLLNNTAKYGAINFRIVKFICVAGQRISTTDQLREQINLEKKTIIFPEWRSCAYKHCNLEMRHTLVTPGRTRLLYTMKREKQSPLNISYSNSDLVTETANFFIKKLNPNKEPYVSVYMRIEKMLKINNTINIKNSYLKCCTSMLQKVLAGVKKKFKLTNVLLTTDLGRYGSDACPGDCQLVGREVLKDIEKVNKIKVFNYDPSKTLEKIDNSGFAAMVEMEMLAGAKRLITVGPGLFKEQVTRLYKKANPNVSVYSICKELGLHALFDFNDFPSQC